MTGPVVAEPIEAALKREERKRKERQTSVRKTAVKKDTDNPVRNAGKRVAGSVAKRRATTQARNARIKKMAGSAVERETAKVQAANELIRKPRIRMLSAEYAFAILMVIVVLIWGNDSYSNKMGKFFMQVTGLSAIFVLMGLTSNSERASRPVIMFGAFIDVVIFLNAVSSLRSSVAVDPKTGKVSFAAVNEPSSYDTSSTGGVGQQIAMALSGVGSLTNYGSTPGSTSGNTSGATPTSGSGTETAV